VDLPRVLTEDAECVSAITGSVVLDMRDHLNASAQVAKWLIAGAGLEPATPAL
jgi:hypothetical protein